VTIEFQKDVKKRIYLSGHNIAEAVRETGIPFPQLSGYLNGYFGLKAQYLTKLLDLVNRWEGYTP